MIQVEEALTKQILCERLNSRPDSKGLLTWMLLVSLAGKEAPQILEEARGATVTEDTHVLPKLDALTLMGLGIHPRVMLSTQMINSKSCAVYSPWGFAIALLHEGIECEDSLAVLSQYQKDYINDTLPSTLYVNSSIFWESSNAICPLLPESFREKYPHTQALEYIDPPRISKDDYSYLQVLPLTSSFYGWLSPQQRKRALRYVTLYHLPRMYLISKIHDGLWDDDVEQIAKRLLKAETQKQPKYIQLAHAANLISNVELTKWVNNVKGVRQALLVVRPDATVEQMQRGLQTLMNSSSAQEALLARIGRPLDPQEIIRIRSKNIVDFLWQAPWETIEKVSHDRERVLARILPHVGNVDPKKLRECLSPHTRRREQIPPITSEEWGAEQFAYTSWDTVMEDPLAAYRKSCDLRKQAITQCGNGYRAFLLLLSGYTGEYAGNTDLALGKLSDADIQFRAHFLSAFRSNPTLQ